MKRLFIILFLSLPIMLFGSTKSSEPDFAYPQQVIKNGEEMLNQALTDNDGAKVVDALIRIGLAKTSISNDSLNSVVNRIADVRDRETTPTTKALLNLLLADIYTEYYNSNNYIIDERTTVDTPEGGDDFTLLSGKQIKQQIISLIDSVQQSRSYLIEVPLSDYYELIISDGLTRTFYPTLYDFACLRSLKNLEKISEPTAILPLAALFYGSGHPLPNMLPDVSRTAIDVSASWVGAHPEADAARVAALLNRYDVMNGFIADGSGLRDTLISLYRQNIATPYAVELLLKANNIYPRLYDVESFEDEIEYDDTDGKDEPLNKQIYRLLNDFAEKNPGYVRINAVKNALATLSQKSISVTAPRQVAKGENFEIKVDASNISTSEICIYRINDNAQPQWGNRFKASDMEKSPVAVIPVKIKGNVPFSGSATVEAVINDFGRYAAIAGPRPESKAYVEAFACSDIAMISSCSGNDLRLWTVNCFTGAPIGGVSVTVKPTRNQANRQSKLYLTDSLGVAKITLKESGNELTPRLGKDRFGQTINVWGASRDNDNVNRTAFIKASLPLYHPGDTMEVFGICYEYGRRGRTLMADEDVLIKFRDANYQEFATVEGTTDSYGRVSAKAAIPKDGLTGHFSVDITDLDGQSLGSELIMVSDYKLPTFIIEIGEPKADSEGNVAIAVTAKTYSGFPVAEATVKMSLNSVERRWWFSSNSVTFEKMDVTTDSDGVGMFTIPKATLDMAPYSSGVYSIDVEVISPTGESHMAAKTFAVGNPYALRFDAGYCITATDATKLAASLVDLVGNDIDTRLQIEFERDNTFKAYEIDCRGGFAKVDLSQLPSGTYTVTLKDPDNRADEVTTKRVIVYNPADTAAPTDMLLWLPEKSVKIGMTDRSAAIVYSAGEEGLKVLMTISIDGKIFSQKWLSPTRGINREDISLVLGLDKVDVTLSTIYHLKYAEQAATIEVVDPSNGISISFEHLSDRVAPMSEESIKVRITDLAGKGVPSALILDMYNKALDAIESESWLFNPLKAFVPGVSYSHTPEGSADYTHSNRIADYKYPAIGMPVFNFYKRSFITYRDMDFPVVMYATSIPHRSSKFDMVTEECEVTCADESVMMSANCGVKGDGGENGKTVSEQELDKYRPSEIALAFFAPLLTTDEQGRATFEFTVPDANTTWRLNALAYTQQLATQLDVREIVSARPLMVEPNLPRFVRTGDRALVRAAVMNSTDSATTAKVTIQIVNAADMKVIQSEETECTVAPNGSATVVFAINAPLMPGATYVLVKASAGNFTDAVRTLLPVLESSQPVIDSQTFYIPVNDLDYTAEIYHPYEGERNVVVSFCEDPTWEVVSALPGLRKDDGGTSLGASAQVFAGTVARHILKINPEIEPALSRWLAEAKDSEALLSMLNRNDDLKQMLLTSTPWVEAAANDEERITRLALLFQPGEIDASINQWVTKLAELQQPDGGWCWTSNYRESSEWLTEQILNNFAYLKRLGCLPAELDKAVERALDYTDAEVGKTYARWPDSRFFYYAFVRSAYDKAVKGDAAKAINATVKDLVKDWKNLPTAGKAAAALVLYRNGQKAEAHKILESLREFAQTSPEYGMWWDSTESSTWWCLYRNAQATLILDAFNEIEPGCKEIDLIRQWIILNKTVQDWGTSVNASAYVGSILSCGTSWLHKPGDAVVRIDGKKITPTDADLLTGEYVAQINPDARSLQVTRSQECPSWGAIVTRSIQPMSEIRASSIPELSLRKEIVVAEGTDGTLCDGTLAVGQTVKIRLIIDTMRDMDYVTIVDNRAACMEPVVQTPRPVWSEGICFYLENRDDRTNLFINRLPKGRYILEYDMKVNNGGTYSSGIATIQSQYRPEMTAHSGGIILNVD